MRMVSSHPILPKTLIHSLHHSYLVPCVWGTAWWIPGFPRPGRTLHRDTDHRLGFAHHHCTPGARIQQVLSKETLMEWMSEWEGWRTTWERGIQLRLGIKEGSGKRALEPVLACCQWGSSDTNASVNLQYKSLTKKSAPKWKITRMGQAACSGLSGLALHVPDLKVYKRDWWPSGGKQ